VGSCTHGVPALSAGFTREGHFSGEQHSGMAAAASVPASFLSFRAPKAGVGVENTSICASKGRARIEVSAQHDHGIYRRIPHVLNLRSELLN